jgi:lysophospholipase L1-like esterase
MKIVLIIGIILALYVLFFYGRFKLIVSHSHLARIVQTPQTIGTGSKIKYIAAGDSTAVGEGASEVSKTYTYQIAQVLSHNNSVEYQNVGVLGATSQDLIDNQLDLIVGLDPDIITISIGANDMTHFVNNSKVLENYQK